MAVSFFSRLNLGCLCSLPSSPTSFRYPIPPRLCFSCSVFPNSKYQRPYTTVMVVPTGVGAAIGGYAGDALPVARTLASVADCVISHPNVLNAAMLYWPMPNTLYVEGYALDRFAEGLWALQPVHHNKKNYDGLNYVLRMISIPHSINIRNSKDFVAIYF